VHKDIGKTGIPTCGEFHNIPALQGIKKLQRHLFSLEVHRMQFRQSIDSQGQEQQVSHELNALHNGLLINAK